MLCPYAMELLWHGSAPLAPARYPTASESKYIHDVFMGLVAEVLGDAGVRVVSLFVEYEHEIGFVRGDEILCAVSRADIVATAGFGAGGGGGLMNLYIEVSSTRINVAKPWQALLRGIALYYEWRLPVGVVIVSPEKIMYKLVGDGDQENVLRRINRGPGGFQPSPSLCSLCELAHYCPYRAI